MSSDWQRAIRTYLQSNDFAPFLSSFRKLVHGVCWKFSPSSLGFEYWSSEQTSEVCQGVLKDAIQRGLITKLREVDILGNDEWTFYFRRIVKNWLISEIRRRKLDTIELTEEELPGNETPGVEMGPHVSIFLASLTPRQRQIVRGLCEGQTQGNIAKTVGIGDSMVGNEKQAIAAKILSISGPDSKTLLGFLAALLREMG